MSVDLSVMPTYVIIHANLYDPMYMHLTDIYVYINHIIIFMIMMNRARLKQNLWPVIMLIEDNGLNEKPYYHDLRTHRIPTAISVAKSEKFLVGFYSLILIYWKIYTQ